MPNKTKREWDQMRVIYSTVYPVDSQIKYPAPTKQNKAGKENC